MTSHTPGPRDLPPEVTRGRVTRMGWKKYKSGDRFQAVIEFPDGPPHWPLDVVWKAKPILLAIEAEGRAVPSAQGTN